MAYIQNVRTSALLRNDPHLAVEHPRFLMYLQESFDTPAVIAVLSNYVHQEEQNFTRRAMFAVTDEAFDIAWDNAALLYENSPEGDSTAHGYFMAFLDEKAPYQAYDYYNLLKQAHRKPLVDSMISLVRRN